MENSEELSLRELLTLSPQRCPSAGAISFISYGLFMSLVCIVVAKAEAHDHRGLTYNILGGTYADIYAVDEFYRPRNPRD